VTCPQIRDLLSAYADGELDLVRGLEIERHLQGCPTCAAALERTRSLSALLGDAALYHQPPPGLQERVRASLGRVKGARGRLASLSWRRLGAVAAAAALVTLALWGAIRGLSAPSAEEWLAREVVAGHVRSLLAEHLVDVKSSDQHAVKPWFIGKVDFAPDVKELAQQDFPLVGGRLDYVGGQRVAALVYRRNQHFINVFVWRAAGEDGTPEYLERQGYHLIRWTEKGRTFWVVSDLNEPELRAFAELLRR
jgi:anti-sigma factor RsiW